MSDRLVYRYGLLAPTERTEDVRALMRAAHHHRNTLIEIERGRRGAARELIARVVDVKPFEEAHDQAKRELAQARMALSAERARTRSKSETDEQKARVAAAKAAKDHAYRALKEARGESREMHKDIIVPELRGFYARATELEKSAYAHSLLQQRKAWGTRCVLTEAIDQVRKMPLYEDGEPNDPRFKRWSDGGRLGSQLHAYGQGGHGFTVVELFDGSGMPWIWIERLPGRPGRRAAHRARLHMRIGTDESRAAIVATWPMIMHREPPKNGVLKRLSVHVRSIGPREEWSVSMTFDTSATPVRDGAPKSGGVVAVDIGWRKVRDGMIVATALDDEGRSEQLKLPPEVAGGFARCSGIESVRKTEFNAARDGLIERLASVELPEWMRAATATLGQWKSPARLSGLARRWADARFDGDAVAFGALNAWRYHDRHLWSWSTSQSATNARRRKDAYGVWAAQLARRYRTVVMSDAVYRRSHKRVAESDPRIEEVERARTIASPGELRDVLRHGFTVRGGEAKSIDCAGLATLCPSCGGEMRQSGRDVTCLVCTFARDVDTAQGMNLLRRAGLGDAVDAMVARGRDVKRELEDEEHG